MTITIEAIKAEKAAAERAEANRIAAEGIRRIDAERKASMAAFCVEELPKFEIQPALSSIADTQATIKLGEICTRLGFTITAEFLVSLGYRPVATDKNAKLYTESQWRGICSALVQHISNVAVGTKKTA